MYPEHIERYYAPTTVAEICGLLREQGEGAKLLAGGQSLIPLMKAREIAPRALIDINRVGDFDAVEVDERRLKIGALVRHRRVAFDPSIQRHATALTDAAFHIGDMQVRNRGTLIGNLVHADHTGDMLAPSIALDGTLMIISAAGALRTESVDAFVLGSRACHLADDEIVVGIEFPLGAEADGSCYVKHGRVAQDRATLGVAMRVSLNDQGDLCGARIVIGGITPRPARMTTVESALIDGTIDPHGYSEAGELAASAVVTQSDELASAAYRSQLIRVMVPDCLTSTLERAGRAG